MTDEQLYDGILRALRRITRSIDLHSRDLVSRFGLTGPQLVCLRYIDQLGQVTPGAVAREVSLSQATVTGIIDRLVARGWVSRIRGDQDRRQVSLSITDEGRMLVARAPYPLQESFLERLAEESVATQRNILATLEQVVRMMDGEGIDAAPMLSTTAEVADVPEGYDEAAARASGRAASAASGNGSGGSSGAGHRG